MCFSALCLTQTVLSLEILVACDFDKVAGTAIYYLQHYYMWFIRIIGKVAGGSHGTNQWYRRLATLVDNTAQRDSNAENASAVPSTWGNKPLLESILTKL